MNWIYKNNTQHTIIYRNNIWLPGQELEISYPVPDYLPLSCIQKGKLHDPVLVHNDVIVDAGSTEIIYIDAPDISHNVALSIINLSPDSAVLCRFNSENNKPIPIDVRGFQHILPWVLCSHIFLENISDTSAHISITAIAVVS